MLLITDGQPRNLGYVEIDQRNVDAPLAPGVERHFKADTYTCSHCTAVIFLNPRRKRERYKCSGCNRHVCDNCAAAKAAGGGCLTFWQQREEALERVARQIPEPRAIILP